MLSLWRNAHSNATPPDFLDIDVLIMGIIKVCLCLICSQNETLQTLSLAGNDIGDVGAASIGDALTYAICWNIYLF